MKLKNLFKAKQVLSFEVFPPKRTAPVDSIYEALDSLRELHPDFIIEKGMQENLIHCILHARRLLTLEEGLRWQDIKRYGIVIYRRYYEGYTLVNITDKMDTNDPRRAIQLPASVITAGMQPNPRND